MDVKIVSSITRLANYMPLGSYVIYTALETYSFSLGPKPMPFTTIVTTPSLNYTCYYNPEGAFTYTTCNGDQSSALILSLTIGFFLAVFLSFLKQVPKGGTPPLADGEVLPTPGTGPGTPPVVKLRCQKPGKRKYRRGVVYAEGNFYYLDFGDFHVWGHAALSFVAFGTLSLFSASVSQCLFPRVRPWIFVFTQVVMLVICCFIAMFWIHDPSLSIGLMVVPQTDNHGTQTSIGSPSSNDGLTAGTSTTDLLAASRNLDPTGNFPSRNIAGLSLVRSLDDSTTGGMSANAHSAMSATSSSEFSNMTAVGVGGYGYGNMGGANMSRMGGGRTKQSPTMSSLDEKDDLNEKKSPHNGALGEQNYSDVQRERLAEEGRSLMHHRTSS
ncbi:hypothetical protein BGZ70_008142 [Mortierella alpina]|uniref:Uncharacterized protein n=1 Tax=Mortierella alpina TaxID=64518 RepID=A0A9P6M224_MORAP|nr:hypothetical protein BGZ70_008142 [Mortierella alpina]